MYTARRFTVLLSSIILLSSPALAQEESSLLEQGRDALQAQQFSEAVDLFTGAIALDSTDADAYCGRGIAYLYAGPLDSSIADLDRAIELRPNHVAAYFNRGNAYAQAGRNTEANRDFSWTLMIDSMMAPAYYMRGQVYMQLDSLPEAAHDLYRAMYLEGKEGPRRARMKNVLGSIGYPIPSDQRARFSDRKERVSLELPKEWHHVAEDNGIDGTALVAMQPIDSISDHFMVGAAIHLAWSPGKRLSRGAKAKFPASTKGKGGAKKVDSLWMARAWAMDLDATAKSSYRYTVSATRDTTVGGLPALFRVVDSQASLGWTPMRAYELLVPHGDLMITLRLQSPVVLFEDYRPIFDRAVTSLELK